MGGSASLLSHVLFLDLLIPCSKYVGLIDLTKESESDSDNDLPIVDLSAHLRWVFKIKQASMELIFSLSSTEKRIDCIIDILHGTG